MAERKWNRLRDRNTINLARYVYGRKEPSWSGTPCKVQILTRRSNFPEVQGGGELEKEFRADTASVMRLSKKRTMWRKSLPLFRKGGTMLTDIPYQREVPKMPKCKPVKRGELMEYIKSEHYDHVRNDYGRELVIPSEREWVEVKRGKWIERQHFYNEEETIDEWQSERCTKCDKYLTTPYRYYFFHHSYCPYCGARMEE